MSTADMLPVWVDGGLVSPDAAMVTALDAGLRSGLGVFATLRAHGTTAPATDLHLQRLHAGADRLGIPFDTDLVHDALHSTLTAPRMQEQVVARITLTAGAVGSSGWPPTPTGRPTLVITLHPAPPLPLLPGRAVTTSARRWPADVKSTSYVASALATREAHAAGADVAVLVDGEDLLETAEGNLFVLLDGMLVTPPDDGRILAGVTRHLLLEAARRCAIPTKVAPLRLRDVARADALMATSSVVLIRTILSIDGVGPGQHENGPEHPIVLRLRDQLSAALD